MIPDEGIRVKDIPGKRNRMKKTAQVVNSKEIRKPDGSGRNSYPSNRKLFSQVI